MRSWRGVHYAVRLLRWQASGTIRDRKRDHDQTLKWQLESDAESMRIGISTLISCEIYSIWDGYFVLAFWDAEFKGVRVTYQSLSR